MKKCAVYLLTAGLAVFWMNQVQAASLNTDSLQKLLEQSRQYEFGQSRRLLTDIENQIKSVYGSPEELAAAESILLETLQSDCSFALKDFLCRQLSLIGSARSVPVLTGLLKDPKTAALAQYALVRIPSPEADKALAEHLAQAEPSVRIGLLTSLGLRKSQAAVSAIARYASDENPSVAEAAISALGQIGTLEAASALEKQMEKIPPALQPRAYDALLACGDNLLRSGQKEQAASLYRGVYEKKDGLEPIRSAAFAGLLQSLPSEEADRMMLEQLEGTDGPFRTVCLLWACRLNRPAVLQKARQMMPTLPDWQQVQFLTALGETKSPAAKETALAALSSSSPEVLLAALETLSAAGDASCVQPLAQTAAQASDRRIRQAAQEALERLPDPKTDSVIAERLQAADFSDPTQSAQAAELIRAAGLRAARQTFPAVLKAAASSNRSVRRAALEALSALAEPADIPGMMFLLEKPDGEVVKLMVAVASKQSERAGRARPFLDLLSAGTLRPSAGLYQILGRLGDPDSLDFLRKGLQAENAELQEAAFRGLTEWPGSEVMAEMKRWTAEGKTDSHRVLAFRAYVRMIRQSELSNDRKAAALSEALGLAPRSEDKKIVLAALAEVPCEQTLSAAVGCLAEESIRPEAQAAVLAICQKTAADHPERCRDALEKLLASSPAEQVEKAARELLKTIQNTQ